MSNAEVTDLVRKAEGDYGMAVQDEADPQRYADQICTLCQQCVEKYLKALIVDRGEQYPKTHRLERLAQLAASAEPEVKALFGHLAHLKSNINFRYPGWNASAEDAEAARQATSYLRTELRSLLALSNATR